MTTEHDHGGSVGTGDDHPTDESSTRRILRQVGRLLALPLIGLIRVYQLVISPLTPPTCRYYPSCSAYALTSLQRFGPLKGTWLAVRRVARCHPWAPGGVDHVPERSQRPASRPTNPSGSDLPDAPSTDGADPPDRAAPDSRSSERPTDPQG